MAGFSWGGPFGASRRTRPTPEGADRTLLPPEVPPVSVSGRGISVEWSEPLERPVGAHLLTWWVGYAHPVAVWPSSYLESDDGQAEHVTHAEDWLYRSPSESRAFIYGCAMCAEPLPTLRPPGPDGDAAVRRPGASPHPHPPLCPCG